MLKSENGTVIRQSTAGPLSHIYLLSLGLLIYKKELKGTERTVC